MEISRPDGWPVPPEDFYNAETPDENEWSHEDFGAEGTLALWPGGVRHWVPQHAGGGQRISIAFNVAITYQST